VRVLGKVVGHIPARAGSERVLSKNLRYIAGKPLLRYSIEAALACPQLDEVVVNTDGDDTAALAHSCGAKVFRRDPQFASSEASGDSFTYDFISKYQVDTLVMVSPVCPMVTPADISEALTSFQNSDADTLITSSDTQMQTFCGGKPVNIDLNGPLEPTQNNTPVRVLNWAVTVWDCAAYRRHFEADGYAYIGRKRVFLEIDPLHSIKISTERDFRSAERILLSRTIKNNKEATYWKPEISG